MNAPHSKTAPRLLALVVGDARHHELCRQIDELRRFGPVQCVEAIDEAAATLRGQAMPEYIVFAQSRRGLFCDRDVAALHRLSPLSRLLCLLGSWCEGEMRTGQPLLGVTRVYWHQWRAQLTMQMTGGGPWSLPRTLAPFEQALELTKPIRYARRSLATAVAARSACAYQGLRDALRSEGHSVVWANSPKDVDSLTYVEASSVDWLIWDADDWDSRQLPELKRMRARWRPAKTLLLASWPREEDRQDAAAVGVDTLISKPLVIQSLFAALASAS